MHDWEALWAPYDEGTYAAVMAQIGPRDVVLDIGAGDLRLARAMAGRAKSVLAMERNPDLLSGQAALPPNCRVLVGDARFLPFPEGLTTAVLLMRHCAHVRLYIDKLCAVSCPRLITNARWGLGPEVIDLLVPRLPLVHLPVGWFACHCGHAGFVPGPVALLNEATMDAVTEVSDCPMCAQAVLEDEGWPNMAFRQEE